jgi:hypothetical protein
MEDVAMTPMHRSWMALCVSLAAPAACTPEPAPCGTPIPGSALIVTTDYETGAYAALDPAARRAVPKCDLIHKDAVCRADPVTGYTFVVSRLGADAVEIVDTAVTWEVIGEYSVGAGTNPQDIAVVSADRAYVARYKEPSLLVVDPLDGAALGEVDLSAYADDDGAPEAAWLLAHGDRVYVALQKLAGYEVDGPSSVAVVGAASGEVEREIPLAGANVYGKLRYAVAIDRIPLIEAGRFGALDGGIQLLDPNEDTVSPYVITEAALGGDLADAVVAGWDRGFAVIGVPAEGGAKTRLVAFDPSTGEVGATLIDDDEWELGFMELDPDGDELWVADRSADAPGVRVFDTATGGELTSRPIDVGLPPFMICFPQGAGEV